MAELIQVIVLMAVPAIVLLTVRHLNIRDARSDRRIDRRHAIADPASAPAPVRLTSRAKPIRAFPL